MAAVAGKEEFVCFAYPKVPISAEAARITGITTRNGKMYHLNTEVDAKSISVAIDSLISFLYKFGRKVVIVGHNIQLFDCPVLINALHSCNKLHEISEVVDGFMDTVKLFKLIRPNMPSYKQEYLCETLANLQYAAHDAREDVSALQTLVEQQNLDFQCAEAKASSFTFQYAVESHEYSRVIKANLPSLQPLIDQKVISVGMGRKIAGSGLNYDHLALAFEKNPTEGLGDLCREHCGTLVRVTKSQKIIDKIVNYFVKLNEC